MPKDKQWDPSMSHKAPELPPEVLKRIKELGINHIPADAPGANDMELWPTDQGHTDFRLARGKKPRGGNYA